MRADSVADYTGLEDTPYGVSCHQIEIDIDRSPVEVWPQAIDIAAWMSRHEQVPVDGNVGTVGYFAQVHPRGLGADVPHPRHHTYGIVHEIPEKLILLQVQSERGGSYGDTRGWVTYESIHLVDLGGGRTRVVLSLIDIVTERDRDFEQSRRDGIAEGAHHIEANLRRLKENIEAGPVLAGN